MLAVRDRDDGSLLIARAVMADEMGAVVCITNALIDYKLITTPPTPSCPPIANVSSSLPWWLS